jgi:hypothetical protein
MDNGKTEQTGRNKPRGPKHIWKSINCLASPFLDYSEDIVPDSEDSHPTALGNLDLPIIE